MSALNNSHDVDELSTTTTGSSLSSDDDSSSSGSSVSSSDTEQVPQQAARNPGSAASQSPRMKLNASLQFERPDNEYIPLPPMQNAAQVNVILSRLVMDRVRYPEGRYRMLDYFRAASEMFVHQVTLEYREQRLSADKARRPYKRFTWKNKGELAICFACCCDTLKLLYDTLQPSPIKPLWDPFVNQLAPLLISESKINVDILSEQTYHIKYMDWQKGGTRYGGEQSTANVRFPSAQERRVKIETYLRSRAGYKIETITVDTPPAPPAPVGRPSSSSSVPSVLQPGARVAVKSAPSHQLVAPFTASAQGPGPVRAPVKGPVRSPAVAAGGGAAPQPPVRVATKMPEETRHLYWLSALAHVKGGACGAAFPDERISAMPGLLKLCEMAELPCEVRVLVDVIAASSQPVQAVFERHGGVVQLRRFAGRMIRLADLDGLVNIVECVVRMKVTPWSVSSHRAWRTNTSNKLTADLGWLRAESLIPSERRAQWGALVLIMEEKYIFRPPRPSAASGEDSLKRPRTEGSSNSGACTQALVADNVDFTQWKVPRINTLGAVRLPAELRSPPFASSLEKNSFDLLKVEKQQFAVGQQAAWLSRIEALLGSSAGEGVVLPLWYDPYQMLGMGTTIL